MTKGWSRENAMIRVLDFCYNSIFSRNQMPDKNLFMKERLEGLLTSLEFTGLSGSWLLTQ
jgi:hypothetical protein